MVSNQFIPTVNLEMINNARYLREIENLSQQKTSSSIEPGKVSGEFSDILKSELNKVNNYQIANTKNTEKYLNGEDIDMYEVMVSAKEASMTLQMAVEIRNKLVDAYSEINRMQI